MDPGSSSHLANQTRNASSNLEPASAPVIRGSCFCRAVSYAFTGPPVLSAYCHCTNCQRLSGCPFVHTIHAPSGSFKWTHTPPASDPQDALDALDSYIIPSKPHKSRYRCKTCGACVAGYNSIRDRYSVWGAQLEREDAQQATGASEDVKGDYAGGGGGDGVDAGSGDGRIQKAYWEVVKPTAHIFYETRMVDVEDGLGKWVGYEGLSERIG